MAIKKRIIFLGQRQIAWNALEMLAGEELRSSFELSILVTDRNTYKRVKKELPNLNPRFIPNETRSYDDILGAIQEFNVDLLISIQHNWILSKEILNSVKGKAFNLHNARLPHYQGFNSISHAILNGDDAHYSTIHWMEEKVDSGAIVFEGITPISFNETAISLHRKTIKTATQIFYQFASALMQGHALPRKSLENIEPKYFGRDSLKKIADVTDVGDLVQIDRIARALFYPPYNMAYFVSESGKNFIVPEAGLEDMPSIELNKDG
ncbi:formyltransferase family protein [Pyruvatibacter mobilis]|uniref:formyltransferase family protein n=1 Tax=Pyruvatibacter mobilis TaxID=1712261 RepID=UPI003BA85BFA